MTETTTTPDLSTTSTDPAAAPIADPAAASSEVVLGDAGKKAIEGERAARKAADKALSDVTAKLKEYEDRDKSESQKLLEERDALKAERDLYKIENLRREVAIEKGIDLKAASRLVGTTREELEADADVLAEVLKGAKLTFGTVTATSTTQPVGRIYRQSELNDHAFFQANKADIQAALKEGRITAD